MTTIITTASVSLFVGFIVGWIIACTKIKKSAIGTLRTIIKDYIYRCDIDGIEHQFKFDEMFNEHRFVNNVDKGWHKIIQLVEDNKDDDNPIDI